MHDLFEESLWGLFKVSAPQPDDDTCLGRVLRTANRQVGAGDLFNLMRYQLQALIISTNNGLPYLAPVSHISARNASSANRAR